MSFLKKRRCGNSCAGRFTACLWLCGLLASGMIGCQFFAPSIPTGASAVSSQRSDLSQSSGGSDQTSQRQEDRDPAELLSQPSVPTTTAKPSSGIGSSVSSPTTKRQTTTAPPMVQVPHASGTPAAQYQYTGSVAAGTATMGNEKVKVDYSNQVSGYLMIRYLGTNSKVKVQITGPGGVTYTYDLSTDSKWNVFTFSDGNGDYSIKVFENKSGTTYYAAYAGTVTAKMKDPFAPFLRSNQYVNFEDSQKLNALAKSVAGQADSQLGKIKAVYQYVVRQYSYDYQLANSVTAGYLPVLDTMISRKKGICFDYAALMTAMLRSQGIPTKLVVGYAGNIYHAWISTYSKESGWVEASIYFNGKQWKLMDPTFASTSHSSAEIMAYIGTTSNYTAKYIY